MKCSWHSNAFLHQVIALRRDPTMAPQTFDRQLRFTMTNYFHIRPTNPRRLEVVHDG